MNPKASHSPEVKARARRHARKAVSDLPPEARDRFSGAVRRALADWDVYRKAQTVLVFSALPDEPDLRPMMGNTLKRFVLPRVDGDDLALHEAGPLDDLIPSRWNLLEPDPSRRPLVAAPEIDLALVPGVAFARTGARLGRGKGFYDRLLATAGFRAVTCGVCFSAQILPALPAADHDVGMDWVVSEGGVERAG